ncbi:alpha/beta hydrolase [Asanoa siamensis]|uniref:Alpha/beta hydrolase n=1 Tax=Asanoa siamensis TaxID=926357 RepID=A0ABQ4CQK7_9ACTN|nr:alpha/beta hydrolase [Asanoa siamensis]GIF73551.1 alpha/beta hydrolase [Asanoa siamensis]
MTFHPNLDPELAALLGSLEAPFEELSARPYAELPAAREPWLAEPAAMSDPRVVISDELAGSVPVRIFRPAGVTGVLPGLLWIHGGGLLVGSARSDSAPVGYTTDVPCVTVSVDYRLAPEHPYPAQVDDCFAALVWFFANAAELGVDPGRIAIGGGSAGGGLAAATALRASDAGGPSVVFQLLVAPMLDDRAVTPSSSAFDDPRMGWTASSNRYAWRALLGDRAGGPDVSPYAAPARATDLSGLPPTYLCVGELEVFRDECVDYAARLMRAGVPTELHVFPGAFHGWEFFPSAAVSRRSVSERVVALRRAFHRS